MKARRCVVPDCDIKHEAKGYCRRHYRAYKKHGDPLVRGVSSTQFTSEEVARRWRDDPRYRATMLTLHTGESNNRFTGAKKAATCLACGTAFKYYPSNRWSGKYCSRKCSYTSPERSEKLRQAQLGKKATIETRKKLSESHIGLLAGAASPSWKGGISKLAQGLRSHPEYARWRQAVFAKDDYTCQLCGIRGGRLEADHHPYSFSKYPERRLDVDNGRALCKPCHHHVTYVTKEWR